MKTKRGRVTAEEHLRELEADPEFMRRRAAQEAERAERAKIIRQEEAPLIKDLAHVGIHVESAWYIKKNLPEYRNAIPVLLAHLSRPYSDIVRSGIAQALAAQDARKTGWRLIVDEFRKTDATGHHHVKDSLAVALAGAADSSVLNEVIDLARDKSHGASRILLLRAIRRSKRPEARQAIADLSSDPQLELEIQSWKRR